MRPQLWQRQPSLIRTRLQSTLYASASNRIRGCLGLNPDTAGLQSRAKTDFALTPQAARYGVDESMRWRIVRTKRSRREISRDIQHQVRRVRREDADRAGGCGDDRHVRGDRSIQGIERRNKGLRRPLRP